MTRHSMMTPADTTMTTDYEDHLTRDEDDDDNRVTLEMARPVVWDVCIYACMCVYMCVCVP